MNTIIIQKKILILGSYGKEFYVGFAEHLSQYRLFVDIASNTSGTLRVFDGYLGINTSYTFNRTRSIESDASLVRLGTGLYKGAGVHFSDVDIAVYVTNWHRHGTSSDTYTALPLNVLGDKYVVASNSPNMFDAVFHVVPTVDLTQRTHRSMNQYDLYQDVGGFDLTGTVVNSNKPVAVVSGLGCSYSPDIHYVSGGCDHQITSLVPSSKGSSVVIVPSIYSHERISTICHHYYGNQTNCLAFSRSNVLNSRVESRTLVVTGSEKFTVVQIKGYMTWIPGVGQYLNEYVFVLPTIYAQQSHYISVIIPTFDISGLILDGILNPSKRLSETVPSPFSNFSVLTIDMNSGYHTIKHSNLAIKFGVICFRIGKVSIYDGAASYGYPAGFQFGIDWCESRPCLHCSRCVRGMNGYTCVCVVGYGGQRCEENIIESLSTWRHVHMNEYICICPPPSHTDTNCQTELIHHADLGQVCFDCGHVQSPRECNTTKPCHKDQICVMWRIPAAPSLFASAAVPEISVTTTVRDTRYGSLSVGAMHLSSYGKQFYVGFAEHFNNDVSYRLFVDIASNTSGTLWVYNSYLGINTSYTFNRTRSIEFGKSLVLLGSGVRKGAGIHLLSDVDIGVYVTNWHEPGTSADTYTALPLNVLGNKYIVASNSPNMFDAVFLVVATVDLTQVNVTSAKGTWTHKSLNRYDVYQEVSGSDLTGTVVYSNKPVAVISGLGCSFSPNIHYVSGGCDHHITSLVPSSKGSSLSFRTSTICHHYVGNQTNCLAFSRANVLDSRVESHAVVVTGSEKFNVVQIKGEQGYMTWIPAVNQYLNEYVFVLPTIYAQQSHYISVIIPTLDISGLILDGILNPPKRLSETVPSPFSNYSVLTIDMNSGYHTIKHSNPAVKFGVICFGIGKLNISDSTASYGYPAGFKFVPTMHYLNDTDTISITVVTLISLCLPPETDWCEARPCLHGSRCVSGVKGYTCVCSMGYSGQRCENKLFLREDRGPVCFDCGHVQTTGKCNTVQPCHKDQICGIEEYDWVGLSHFKMGCVDISCGVLDMEDSRRSVPVCKSCCAGDFCNHNCTRHSLGVII
ncbi:LOW QUALITY PROTEIN: FCGBP-like protein, partial [Mya arenaria]